MSLARRSVSLYILTSKKREADNAPFAPIKSAESPSECGNNLEKD